MAKKKGGRKGKYHDWLTKEGLIKLEGWARDGLTNEQISHNIGINPDTLYTWIKKFPEISDTLKRGKEVIDRQVENALLKRALGYKFDEVTYEPVAVKPFEDSEGNRVTHVLDVTKKVTKEVAPDTTAQIFWLKNRKPAEWRDKRDIEHSGNMNVNNPFQELTTEDLKKLIKE
ncbi:helix-turn-helix domain-containing protein [Bacillus sp. FSL K6-3431]|uniref:helix-turn-helix domain-containing protein n=1 Tax=Bacillus sp. FSL K6-3431 TaxID=2921500 RepID=UPI0030F59D7F